MRGGRMRVFVLALACGGCIPSVPFVVGETAEVLKPREVSAAVYGGGGAFTGTGSAHDCCGGAMARLRVGIGQRQEVGVEGGAYFDGNGAWGTAKATWKLQLNEHYAVFTGIGASFIDSTYGVGGDAGVIASTSPFRDRIRLYAALRATMMISPDVTISDGGGVLSGGIAYEPTARLRVALEVGVIGAGFHDRDPIADVPANAGWFGGYGAALVSYAWRR